MTSLYFTEFHQVFTVLFENFYSSDIKLNQFGVLCLVFKARLAISKVRSSLSLIIKVLKE